MSRSRPAGLGSEVENTRPLDAVEALWPTARELQLTAT